MAEIPVGPVEAFAGDVCRLVEVEGREIGVRQHGGEFFAYENVCLHQGGPVCEGMIIGKVEQRIGPGGEALERRFSEERPHLVCPWHGVEYDLRTGTMIGGWPARLRKYDVVERNGEVYVVV